MAISGHKSARNVPCLTQVNVGILRSFIVLLLFNQWAIILVLYFLHNYHAYRCGLVADLKRSEIMESKKQRSRIKKHGKNKKNHSVPSNQQTRNTKSQRRKVQRSTKDKKQEISSEEEWDDLSDISDVSADTGDLESSEDYEDTDDFIDSESDESSSEITRDPLDESSDSAQHGRTKPHSPPPSPPENIANSQRKNRKKVGKAGDVSVGMSFKEQGNSSHRKSGNSSLRKCGNASPRKPKKSITKKTGKPPTLKPVVVMDRRGTGRTGRSQSFELQSPPKPASAQVVSKRTVGNPWHARARKTNMSRSMGGNDVDEIQRPFSAGANQVTVGAVYEETDFDIADFNLRNFMPQKKKNAQKRKKKKAKRKSKANAQTIGQQQQQRGNVQRQQQGGQQGQNHQVRRQDIRHQHQDVKSQGAPPRDHSVLNQVDYVEYSSSCPSLGVLSPQHYQQNEYPSATNSRHVNQVDIPYLQRISPHAIPPQGHCDWNGGIMRGSKSSNQLSNIANVHRYESYDRRNPYFTQRPFPDSVRGHGGSDPRAYQVQQQEPRVNAVREYPHIVDEPIPMVPMTASTNDLDSNHHSNKSKPQMRNNHVHTNVVMESHRHCVPQRAWICSSCSTLNAAGSTACELCSSPQPTLCAPQFPEDESSGEHFDFDFNVHDIINEPDQRNDPVDTVPEEFVQRKRKNSACSSFFGPQDDNEEVTHDAVFKVGHLVLYEDDLGGGQTKTISGVIAEIKDGSESLFPIKIEFEEKNRLSQTVRKNRWVLPQELRKINTKVAEQGEKVEQMVYARQR